MSELSFGTTFVELTVRGAYPALAFRASGVPAELVTVVGADSELDRPSSHAAPLAALAAPGAPTTARPATRATAKPPMAVVLLMLMLVWFPVNSGG